MDDRVRQRQEIHGGGWAFGQSDFSARQALELKGIAAMMKHLFRLVSLLVLCAAAVIAQKSGPAPCCSVTSLDPAKNLVTARENANDRVFSFSVPDKLEMERIRKGQPVYANFKTREVSLNGTSSCCKIVQLGAPPSQPLASGAKGAGEPVRLTYTVGELAHVQLPPGHQPHPLPDLVAIFPSAKVDCAYYPSQGQTCQNTCASKTITRAFGVWNQTAIPAVGTITIKLLDNSNNLVAGPWAIDGLAGNADRGVAHINYPFICPAPNTDMVGPSYTPNRKLVVEAPGVHEFVTENNILNIYIDPSLQILNGPH
jgi:hypothetical protein